MDRIGWKKNIFPKVYFGHCSKIRHFYQNFYGNITHYMTNCLKECYAFYQLTKFRTKVSFLSIIGLHFLLSFLPINERWILCTCTDLKFIAWLIPINKLPTNIPTWLKVKKMKTFATLSLISSVHRLKSRNSWIIFQLSYEYWTTNGLYYPVFMCYMLDFTLFFFWKNNVLKPITQIFRSFP